MPKVSVIMPTYNSEKTIEKSIKSVLLQTFQDFILIIVDDGSIDKTAEICKKYVNEYSDKIEYYRIDNHGVSYARNVGIEHSKSEYVFFIDSDDLYEKEMLFEMIKKAEEIRC